MRLRNLAVGGAALLLALAGAGSASAATEFGDACVANDATNEVLTLFGVSAPGDPLPTAAPSAGVLTAWKVGLVPAAPQVPQTLNVLRLNSAAKTAQVVGESSTTVNPGSNVIPTRIPVQAGDRLALYGPEPIGTLVCETSEPTVYGGYEGSVGIGGNSPYEEVPGGVRIPVVGVLEPDADGDGYGDETQDKCPQSAAVQTECPVVILDAFVLPKKSSVVVIVNTSTTAPVTVSASAKLPNDKKKAKASATAKLKKVTHNVTPGKLRYFSLKYPAGLKEALADLPKGKKLKLKITAAATNVAGQVSTDKTIVKLKGAA